MFGVAVLGNCYDEFEFIYVQIEEKYNFICFWNEDFNFNAIKNYIDTVLTAIFLRNIAFLE